MARWAVGLVGRSFRSAVIPFGRSARDRLCCPVCVSAAGELRRPRGMRIPAVEEVKPARGIRGRLTICRLPGAEPVAGPGVEPMAALCRAWCWWEAKREPDRPRSGLQLCWRDSTPPCWSLIEWGRWNPLTFSSALPPRSSTASWLCPANRRMQCQCMHGQSASPTTRHRSRS